MKLNRKIYKWMVQKVDTQMKAELDEVIMKNEFYLEHINRKKEKAMKYGTPDEYLDYLQQEVIIRNILEEFKEVRC